MWQFFLSVDAVQIEINPLVETADNKVVCVDAKIQFDDNSQFRHKDVFLLDETSESDPREVMANAHNLNYIGMDGNIGCLGKIYIFMHAFLCTVFLIYILIFKLTVLGLPWQQWI